MPWIFLLVSLVGAWFTYNALRPVYREPRLAFLSFLAGVVTSELALHHIAWQAAMTLIFAWAGALQAWPGVVGLAVTASSWLGLAQCHRLARMAQAAVEHALCEGLGAAYQAAILPEVRATLATRIDRRWVALPFPIRDRGVERLRDIPYRRVAGLDLKLDVYRHRSHPTGCPTLLQIHGGGWVMGSKNQHGLPLMMHLAARGWVCVSVNYRLSPHATFPDQLIDLKSAVRWIRERGRDHGADPDFLVVTGGSAGGHLAALVALTANDPAYQPGFVDVDTSVAGCVAFYGVYDLLDRNRLWPHDGCRWVLERQVMKASVDEARGEYEKASPLSRLRADAPPFFVIHGDRDSMVPVAEARQFVEAYRRLVRAPLVYAELPGAQHAFELFPSLRALLVIHGVERFLAYLYSQHLASCRAPAARSEKAPAPGVGRSPGPSRF